MSDRFSNLIEQLMEMTEMTEEEKARMMEAINNIEELRRVEDISDLEDLDLDFDEIDIDEMEDLQNLLEEIDNLPIDSIGDIDLNDLETSSIKDYFNRANDYLYEPETEDVEIDLENADVEEQPYHGRTWMQVDDSYEAFVNVPSGTTETDVEINVQNDEIAVTDPINETLSTEELPIKVSYVDAEIRGERLFIQVE